ncbi:MAG: hypothetical protein JNL53_05495 [Cyclobacteriaceae bacterium]|nr:hypothetical protein [Cyclobacteriaceae bacterium]
MLRLIFRSLLISQLVGMSILSQAQDVSVDSTRRFVKPTSIRLGTDVIRLGQTIANSSFSGWELNVDTDLGRYYPTLDYGRWTRDTPIDNGTYSNDGRYFRLGVDYNFLKNDPDNNMFFMGIRYGRSKFDEQVVYDYSAIDFGDFQKEANNTSAKAGWLELTTGIRVKMWKQFWMGYTARLKFLPSVSGDDGFETYEIPGFGLTYKDIYWGFNYQVFWRIPLKADK